jgi:hypothetical protein
MGVLSRCDEISIFKTDLVKDLVDYKWDTYAYRSHILSAMFHVIYVIVLIYYINHTYLEPYMEEHEDKYEYTYNEYQTKQADEHYDQTQEEEGLIPNPYEVGDLIPVKDLTPDAFYLYF